MSGLQVEPQARGFGAVVRGLDLGQPLAEEQTAELRRLWIEFGHDPYVKAIDGHQHVLEIRREPDEKVPPFGAAWHSDWSFQESPPAATLLHAKIVPPVGGDTLFADGYAALEALDPGLVAELEPLVAIHSARRPC